MIVILFEFHEDHPAFIDSDSPFASLDEFALLCDFFPVLFLLPSRVDHPPIGAHADESARPLHVLQEFLQELFGLEI